jgi:glycosyltransferase involved in cell wall biosynthesis
MRIAYITAGAGGMLCGSCLHDNTLAAAIRGLGHDIALIPTYTPIRTDEADVSLDEVFYGAINIYLQRRSSFFRRTPRFFDRLLDHPALLGWVARRASTTSAAELGALTLSVLRGEQGSQRKELDRLVAWLRDDFKPEVVHLTNSMFLGLAGGIRRETGVPVICSVQGEDLFLDRLEEPYRGQVIAELRARAGDVDTWIAPCRDHADRMSELIGVPRGKMLVVPLGLNLDGYAPGPPTDMKRPFTIGYLARFAPEKGFHLLIEAFRLLAERADRAGGRAVLLRAAGYLGENDRRWFEQQTARLASWGLADRFELIGEVDHAGKIAFLRDLDVLSVPTIYREAKGLFVLEALAAGVPFVQPAHGSFPEMLERTGGGLLFEPGSAEDLARKLGDLMEDPALRSSLGGRGNAAVRANGSAGTMAAETMKVYLAARGDRCTS